MDDMKISISVIIPCRNAVDSIATQLEALGRQHWHEPWEVVLSDNGSTDGTMAVVGRYMTLVPNLRIVDSSDRRGAAHARNVGARAAAGDALVFCDADDEVGAGWLAAMGEALCEHDFVANRMDFEKLNAPWVAKAFKNHPQSSGLQRVWYPPYLLHAGSGGLGVRRSLHESIGGFDESLMRLMDTDYCFRVQHAGTKLHFVPNALMHVRCQEDAKARFHQARLWAKYNVLMYKRYRPPDTRYPRPWRRYVGDWARLARSLVRLPRIRSREAWAWCVWQLGWQIGLLQGSLKYRVTPVPHRVYEMNRN